MSTTEKKKFTAKGGEFLIKRNSCSGGIYARKSGQKSQKMIAQTCKDFLDQEVYPRLDEIDDVKNNPEIMPQLMDKSGELGLLGTSVPEEYGGFGMDFNTSMLVAEVIGAGHSFAVALSAHTGIGNTSYSLLW